MTRRALRRTNLSSSTAALCLTARALSLTLFSMPRLCTTRSSGNSAARLSTAPFAYQHASCLGSFFGDFLTSFFALPARLHLVLGRYGCNRQGRRTVVGQEFSPTKAVSIRRYVGQCAISLLSMDSCGMLKRWIKSCFFSADLRSEKEAPKVLVFQFSITFHICTNVPPA